MLAEPSVQRMPQAPFVPAVRLFMDRILLETEEGGYQEVDRAVVSLSFDYGREGSVRPSDDGVFPASRDFRKEAEAQRLLESFGAVEIECVDGVEPSFGSTANYLVQADDSLHGACSFTAHAVPELRRRGWRVSIDADYQYQVVRPKAWYAEVEPDDGEDDWFNLELGVEVDGQRISLVQALVDIIENHPGASSLEALLRLPARFRAIPVGPNRYLTIPPEQLKRVVRVLLELYRGDRVEHEALRFNKRDATALDGLNEAVTLGEDTPLRWEGDAAVRSYGRSLSVKSPRDVVPTPTGLRATLRPYQASGLAYLQHLRRHDAGGVLADDMGLGKTLQTIAHLVAEKEEGRLDKPALIVVPTSLIGNWHREITRFGPDLSVAVLHGPRRHERWRKLTSADVIVTTYSVLIRDLARFTDARFHIVILDEAQAIKNARSQSKRAVDQIPTRHRLCLTGTPVENNLEELWSLFDFLMPGFLGTVRNFRTRFRHPIEAEGREDVLDALRARVAPYMLRRMKEDVATELPPKTELIRPVELGLEQRELYESIRVAAHSDVRRAIRKQGIAASTVAILDALMKLRQACCDPRLVSVRSARKVTHSAKLAVLLELLKQQRREGRRVLIFSQFTRMLALISKALVEGGIDHVELTGATQNRQKSVDAFQNGRADVFLISLKAGGTGLNLTRADTVIHYDPWWNAAAQSQATDRAYRIGQKRPVFVYNLIVAGSVEERMLKLQQRKQQLANTLLGTGTQSTSTLSPEELDDLFAPLVD